MTAVVCSLCELRLCLPLDVQRKCSEWIKLATANFRDSLAQKSRVLKTPEANTRGRLWTIDISTLELSQTAVECLKRLV